MGQLSVSFISLMIIMFLLYVQVDSVSITRKKREYDQCPKLKYYSDERSRCFSCSLCAEDVNPRLKRSECVAKNPNPIPHYEGQRLWCDEPFPYGKFPECPPLEKSVVLHCSENCNDLRRKYAPGCECKVGCSEEDAVTIRCGIDIQWNNRSKIQTTCRPKAPQNSIMATETTLKTVSERLSESADNTLLIPFVISSVVVVLVVALLLIFVYRRPQCQRTGRDSDSLSVEKHKTEQPLLNSSAVALGNGEQDVSKSCCYHVRAPVDIEANPEPAVLSNGQLKQKCVGRSDTLTLAINPSPGLERESDVGPEGQYEVELINTSDNSLQALEALINNRTVLKKLCDIFDQKDGFEKVTWHVIAHDLAGWDPVLIRSTEYLRSHNAGNGIPGDGHTYKVLEELLHKQKKGLFEIIAYLEKSPHNCSAKDLLQDFWMKWKSANCPGNLESSSRQ